MCSKTSYEHRNTWGNKTSHEVAVQTRKGHTGTLSFNKHFCNIALHPKLSCGTNWDKFDIFEQLHWYPICLKRWNTVWTFSHPLFVVLAVHMDGRHKVRSPVLSLKFLVKSLGKLEPIPRARKGEGVFPVNCNITLGGVSRYPKFVLRNIWTAP